MPIELWSPLIAVAGALIGAWMGWRLSTRSAVKAAKKERLHAKRDRVVGEVATFLPAIDDLLVQSWRGMDSILKDNKNAASDTRIELQQRVQVHHADWQEYRDDAHRSLERLKLLGASSDIIAAATTYERAAIIVAFEQRHPALVDLFLSQSDNSVALTTLEDLKADLQIPEEPQAAKNQLVSLVTRLNGEDEQ